MKVRPIFEELSSTELLRKGLHRRTQNQNESFNVMIWELIPKTSYVSLTQLQLGVFDEVCHLMLVVEPVF